MIKKIFASTAVLACLLLAACKKPGNDSNPSNNAPEPVVTPKGVANGAASSKQIGAGGGELVSADGNVKIVVPAGAVAANTEFTVQPITNTLIENNPARKAYRLLPEGNNFAKPVKVVFKYAPANFNGGNEDLLTAVYQSANGSWKQAAASLNKTAKTVEISTMHFSDWQVLAALELEGPDGLGPGAVGYLHIYGMYNFDDPVDGALSPLTNDGWRGNINISNWRKVKGPGTLSSLPNDPGPISYQKNFTAPASVATAETAEVAVTVRGNITIPDSSAPNNKRVFQEVTLLKEILIYPNAFMTGTFGGRTINFTSVLYTSGQGFEISGRNGQEEIVIMIDAAPGKGSFPSGDFIAADGNSKTSFSFPDPNSGSTVFFTEYIVCNPVGQVRYHGVVQIEEFGNLGQPIRGSFEGNLYRATAGTGSCPQYDIVPLRIRFGCIRTM